MRERPTIPMKWNDPPILVHKMGRTTVVELVVRVTASGAPDPWTWDWRDVDFSAAVPEGAKVSALVYGGLDPSDENRVVRFRPHAHEMD